MLALLAAAVVLGVGWHYAGQVLQVARVAPAAEADPRTAHGLAYEEVEVPGPLGPLPAWLVPGASPTWVVAVHGRSASRAEALPVLPVLADLGLPVLVVSYRNDVAAPAGPDGHYHLGDTEWEDVDAALAFARGRGARGVVLYGWSMGGAIALETVQRSASRDLVRAVVLDSPVLDWRAVLDAQGAQRGLPPWLTAVAVRVVEERADLDLDELDQVAGAGELDVPVLLVHGTADDLVAPGPSAELARARPDLVTYLPVPGAGHVAGWRVDRRAYEDSLRTFLARHSSSAPAASSPGPAQRR